MPTLGPFLQTINQQLSVRVCDRAKGRKCGRSGLVRGRMGRRRRRQCPAPGPECALARPATPRVAPASILGPSGGLFSRRPYGPVSARSPIWRKRVPRKSGLETKTENEARSALFASLWCHLILKTPPTARKTSPVSVVPQLARLVGGWRSLVLSGLGWKPRNTGRNPRPATYGGFVTFVTGSIRPSRKCPKIYGVN